MFYKTSFAKSYKDDHSHPLLARSAVTSHQVSLLSVFFVAVVNAVTKNWKSY